MGILIDSRLNIVADTKMSFKIWGNTQYKRAYVPLIVFTSLCVPLNANAIKLVDAPLAHRLQQKASVDDVARQINQRRQWRILSAEPMVEDEKTLYRFKLLNKKRGRVRVIIIDPNNPDLKNLD